MDKAIGKADMLSSAEKNKQIQIARNLLDILDNETISVKTELSLNEVINLREELK